MRPKQQGSKYGYISKTYFNAFEIKLMIVFISFSFHKMFLTLQRLKFVILVPQKENVREMRKEMGIPIQYIIEHYRMGRV